MCGLQTAVRTATATINLSSIRVDHGRSNRPCRCRIIIRAPKQPEHYCVPKKYDSEQNSDKLSVSMNCNRYTENLFSSCQRSCNNNKADLFLEVTQLVVQEPEQEPISEAVDEGLSTIMRFVCAPSYGLVSRRHLTGRGGKRVFLRRSRTYRGYYTSRYNMVVWQLAQVWITLGVVTSPHGMSFSSKRPSRNLRRIMSLGRTSLSSESPSRNSNQELKLCILS